MDLEAAVAALADLDGHRFDRLRLRATALAASLDAFADRIHALGRSDAEAEREHSDDGGKEALSVIVDEDDDHLQSPLDNPTSPTSPKSAANSVVTAVSQLSSKSAHSSSLSPVKKGLGLSSQSQHHSK